MTHPRYDHMSDEEKNAVADEVQRILEEAGFIFEDAPSAAGDEVEVTFVVAPLKNPST